MYKTAAIKKKVAAQLPAPINDSAGNCEHSSTKLHNKISAEIAALEKMLATSAHFQEANTIKLLSPTLRSVIRSKKRMLVSLNESQASC